MYFFDISSPMLTFLVSWETCTSMFRLSLLALFLRFPALIASNSEKPSLIGVTAADGTEEVGVLDLLPVLLGVAATESDSDPSSWVQIDGYETVTGKQETERTCQSFKVEARSSDFYLWLKLPGGATENFLRVENFWKILSQRISSLQFSASVWKCLLKIFYLNFQFWW